MIEWVWSKGEMSGITKVLGVKCPSSTFSTSNLTWHGQRLNHSSCGQRSTVNIPSNHGMVDCAWILTIFMFFSFIVWYFSSDTDFMCPSCLSFVFWCHHQCNIRPPWCYTVVTIRSQCKFWHVKGIQCLNICTFCVVNVHFTMYVTQYKFVLQCMKLLYWKLKW